MADDPSALQLGIEAMERGAWEEARACFTAAIEREPSGAAYEGLSWAAWALTQ